MGKNSLVAIGRELLGFIWAIASIAKVASQQPAARSVDFFERVLHLVPMLRTERLTAFDAGQSGVLLVFKRGASLADMPSPMGTVPGHDGSGPLHLAFAIASDAYDEWRRELAWHGVMIHSEVRWARGVRSRRTRSGAGDTGALGQLLTGPQFSSAGKQINAGVASLASWLRSRA